MINGNDIIKKKGLTKREYIAVVAMRSIATRISRPSRIAEASVRLADNLIKELNKKSENR